jgi:predicted amidohydrolase YtcJ
VTAAELSVIVTNARVSTGNPARPWATAIGIRDGKLAVVGMAAEILKMVDAGTRVIDAAGQLLTLAPGTAVGSRVTLTVAPDGRLMVHSPEE